jgi:opacity protein-like surface antigen
MADFSGFYVGPQVSYTWDNTSWQGQYGANAVDFYPDGFSVGPHVGWAYQVDAWVFGLEGAYSSGSFSDQISSNVGTYKTTVSQTFTVTPLAGYAQDNWLFYGKAGFESAKVTVDGNEEACDESYNSAQRQNGWIAGAGVSYKLSESSSLGLEYDFAHLSSTDINTTSTQGENVAFTVNPINSNSVSLIYSHYFF